MNQAKGPPGWWAFLLVRVGVIVSAGAVMVMGVAVDYVGLGG